MSAVWDCGTPRSQNNAFAGAGFVQPTTPSKSAPVRGYERPGYIEPRKVIKSDAANTRLALNNSGKLVRVCMGLQKPSLTIATLADRKVIRKREAAI